jgi:hypothetical protein
VQLGKSPIPATPVAPADCQAVRSEPRFGAEKSRLFHDREWWAAEAARVGSDWAGVLQTHFDALQRLGFVEPVRSSFWFACQAADRAARKRGGRR